MLKSYFKVGWRNLIRDKIYSIINVGGLALGITVSLLLGLWIHDELTFDRQHRNYDRLVQAMQHETVEGLQKTSGVIPMPLESALRSQYGEDFTHLSLFTWVGDHILSTGNQVISQPGNYVQGDFPEMISIDMIHGTYGAFRKSASVLLSESAARALFGTTDVLNRMLRIDNKQDAQVAGVYKDLPHNSTFRDQKFFASWDLYMATEWPDGPSTDWNDNFITLYAQLAPHVSVQDISEKIKPIKAAHLADATLRPEIFLSPMRDWYLRSEWKNGVQTGGRIQQVWMIGTIGLFVLLLACINFMNLSTARSERRSKEVGIRMAIGSIRSQLVGQFLSESALVVMLAFGVAVVSAALALSAFNELTEKHMVMPWSSPYFWGAGLALMAVTSLVAGAYPALFLSSLKPIKVLRGTFKLGRLAVLPRKLLVVFQFTVSVMLAIGTLVVYQQVQFSMNRPVGYDQSGLITIAMKSPDFHGKLNVLQNTLQQAGAITSMAQSSSPVTGIWNNANNFTWPGKDPGLKQAFATIMITPGYGKTVGWTLVEGRDMTDTDTAAMILNEAAVQYMGVKEPLGMAVTWGRHTFYVTGVVKNMVAGSPYEPTRPCIYIKNEKRSEWMLLKLNPQKSAHASVAIIEAAFQQIIPSAPFEYRFVDDDYARKFDTERKTGSLVLLFTLLAIAISCLGLFGLASFVAAQKAKEIGIRKVMGASITSVWGLLSRDFVTLVLIACAIAIPLSIYIMSGWLMKYTYHTQLSWAIFAGIALGAVGVTLLTVSFQSLRAAMMNPVKSLRVE